MAPGICSVLLRCLRSRFNLRPSTFDLQLLRSHQRVVLLHQPTLAACSVIPVDDTLASDAIERAEGLAHCFCGRGLITGLDRQFGLLHPGPGEGAIRTIAKALRFVDQNPLFGRLVIGQVLKPFESQD